MTLLHYILVAAFLLAIELVYFYLARKYNILDVPNQRSAHQQSTIRGIGILFSITVLYYFTTNGYQYPFFFTGVILISGVSFIDDVRPLPNLYRILVQFVSVGLLLYEILSDNESVVWLLVPVLFILAVGIINAYNFMDGINGITGAYSLLTIGTLYYINSNFTLFVDAALLALVGISLMVFLFFNFRKKAIGFCGDVGSISMAFIVTFCTGLLIKESDNWKYLFLLTVYGMDTIYTLLYRLSKKQDIFQAHKLHLFQILVHQFRLSHLQVTGIYVAVQLIINGWVGNFELTNWQFYLPIAALFASVHTLRAKKGVALRLT